MTTLEAVERQKPHCVDATPTDSRLQNAIEDLYERRLDVVVARGSWQEPQLSSVAASLDTGALDPGWNRPNAVMPPEDIQVLGTAATPTYSTPTGPTLDRYLEDANWYDRAPLFESSFDPSAAVAASLAQHSGGRPVELLQTPSGKSFSPFTVRRLTEGKGIGLHHDLHTSLEMFKEVAPGLDRRTLVSYVFTLQGPEAGGELCVYNCAPDEPNPPKKGYMWDLAGVEQRFGSVRVQTATGDLFLFASARLLHRVAPVVGQRARFTLGGFLAMDAAGERVLFWS